MTDTTTDVLHPRIQENLTLVLRAFGIDQDTIGVQLDGVRRILLKKGYITADAREFIQKARAYAMTMGTVPVDRLEEVREWIEIVHPDSKVVDEEDYYHFLLQEHVPWTGFGLENRAD